MFAFGSKFLFKKQVEEKVPKPDKPYLFKVVVAGDNGIGKSCLLIRIVRDSFYHERYLSTIGACFMTRDVKVDEKTTKLQLWDTSGQERFQSLGPMYFRQSDAVLLCFDLSRRESFDRAKHWKEVISRDCQSDTLVLLVGTKADLVDQRQVPQKAIEAFASENNFPYFETSANTRLGVDELTFWMARSLKEREDGEFTPKLSSLSVHSASSTSPSRKDKAPVYDSDEEGFSEEDLETEMTNFSPTKKKNNKNKNKNKNNKNKKVYQKTNVNVFRLDLSKLSEESAVMTGDPTHCTGCSAVHNSFSELVEATPSEVREFNQEVKVGVKAPTLVAGLVGTISSFFSSPTEGEKGKEEETRSYWHCEFCGYYNEIDLSPEETPTSEMVDFIISQAPEAPETEPNVIFCIDISGSMCCTTEVKGKMDFKRPPGREEGGLEKELKAQALSAQQATRRSGSAPPSTYISRLQCVKFAVEQQIEQLFVEKPGVKIGLVSFNDEVTLLGDGQQEKKVIVGDYLESFEELHNIGQGYKIEKSVKECRKELLNTLWSLEETGRTALGPALLLSIAIAGSKPGSKVILCTDGLANRGVGSLEGKNTDYSPLYIEMAERAKLKGVTVSVISLTGTDCALENLSIVAEQTAGVVERVDPLQLTKNFGGILATQVIATGAMATIVLHRGLTFKKEEESEDLQFLIQDLGNVTRETECSFSYGFVPKSQFDLTGIQKIPFQVQLIYTRLNGTKCLRVVTTQINTTESRQEAEENSDVRVIGTYAAKRAGRYAKEGDYEKAQLETRSAQRFMERNGKNNKEEVKVWAANVESFDKELRKEREKEKTKGPVSNVERQKGRAWDDSVSVAVSKATATNARSLFS